MNMLRLPRQRCGSAPMKGYCFCFPAFDFDWKMGCRASYLWGDQVHLPVFASPSFPSLPPSAPSPFLIGRDSHHMCKGEVMGGMAALISERLPADKANGCGEAWASALLRNKHFHFVRLEWRMERWKWWIDDLRSSGEREEMEWMWMLFNINRSIRGWWNMHFVNYIPPFGQRGNITITGQRWLLCHVEIQNSHSIIKVICLLIQNWYPFIQ